MDATTWAAAVAAAGAAGLDEEAWPQAMVSRPLVSATAGGWITGDPAAGFLVGAVLELLFLRHLPFGGARRPDAGPAGVVAGAAHAGSAGGLAPLLAAVLAGWAVGWIGELTVRGVRSLSARGLVDVDALARRPARLERRHLLLTAARAVRGALVAAALLVPATLAVRLAAVSGGGIAAAALAAAALGAGAGAGARGFVSGRAATAAALLGALAGAAVGWGL